MLGHQRSCPAYYKVDNHTTDVSDSNMHVCNCNATVTEMQLISVIEIKHYLFK